MDSTNKNNIYIIEWWKGTCFDSWVQKWPTYIYTSILILQPLGATNFIPVGVLSLSQYQHIQILRTSKKQLSFYHNMYMYIYECIYVYMYIYGYIYICITYWCPKQKKEVISKCVFPFFTFLICFCFIIPIMAFNKFSFEIQMI